MIDLKPSEITEIRNAMGISLAECAIALGHQSPKQKNLRQRMEKYENGQLPMPPGHQRLLIALAIIDDLKHGGNYEPAGYNEEDLFDFSILNKP